MYYLAFGINLVATTVILVKMGFKVYEYFSEGQSPYIKSP